MNRIEQEITLAYQNIESQFNSRPSAYTRTTRDYQNTQRKFLPLALLPPVKRFDAFLIWASGLRWSTTSAYWTAALAAMGALQQQPQPYDRKNTGWLAMRCQQELPQGAPPLQRPDAERIWHDHPDCVSLLVLMAFVLGQRISDVALLRRSRVSLVGNTIALTLVEGKVIRFVGPYTLYLDTEKGVGQLLLAYIRTPQTILEDRLFPEGTLKFASVRLAEYGLENRSCRRGGLQLMAKSGLPLETILLFSKHTTPKMLYRYLDHKVRSEEVAILDATAQTFYHTH